MKGYWIYIFFYTLMFLGLLSAFAEVERFSTDKNIEIEFATIIKTDIKKCSKKTKYCRAVNVFLENKVDCLKQLDKCCDEKMEFRGFHKVEVIDRD